MRIIISHDVDHLNATEHWFRDLVLLKLLVRSTINLLGRRITLHEWAGRCSQPLRKCMNHISELSALDRSMSVPSTFFFGMSKKPCHGMSYKPRYAVPYIQKLWDWGFSCGVHGCEYQDADEMLTEKLTFERLTSREPAGIRMHYVRFDNTTFEKLAQIGYRIDSTEFDKQRGACLKDVHNVGTMTEFPVCIMDSYLPYDFEQAKNKTIAALEEAKENGLRYFTVLFHDTYFAQEYGEYKQWYIWLINYIKETGNEFISFQDAIKEMEQERHG